jgi:hypothetical protein
MILMGRMPYFALAGMFVATLALTGCHSLNPFAPAKRPAYTLPASATQKSGAQATTRPTGKTPGNMSPANMNINPAGGTGYPGTIGNQMYQPNEFSNTANPYRPNFPGNSTQGLNNTGYPTNPNSGYPVNSSSTKPIYGQGNPGYSTNMPQPPVNPIAAKTPNFGQGAPVTGYQGGFPNTQTGNPYGNMPAPAPMGHEPSPYQLPQPYQAPGALPVAPQGFGSQPMPYPG